MGLGRRFLFSRFRSLGLISDLLMVGSAVRSLARRSDRPGPGSRSLGVMEMGELVLAAGAALRLARRARGRRSSRVGS